MTCSRADGGVTDLKATAMEHRPIQTSEWTIGEVEEGTVDSFIMSNREKGRNGMVRCMDAKLAWWRVK